MRVSSFFRPLFMALLAVLFPAALSSCFTGVEGTKRIELSRADRKAIRTSEEESLSDSVKASPLSEWRGGKNFLVTDNRLSLLLYPHTGVSSELTDSIAGKILTFRGTEPLTLPDNSRGITLIFEVDGNLYDYRSSRSYSESNTSIMSDALPMLIDLDMVDAMASHLNGRSLWTRSQLWYSPEGQRRVGRKYVPVTIDKVETGNSVFPLKVTFRDQSGQSAFMYMNFGHSGKDSRSFDSLFSLSDPKTRYPRIDKEVWELICDGKVRNGMTKEECRLSLGSPSDVDGGHDWSQTLDIWKYSDGRYLIFTDGLLSEFRL